MSSSDQKEKDRDEIQENFKRLQAITEQNAKAIAENSKKTNESIEKTRAITEANAKAIAENAKKTQAIIEENAKNTAEWREKTEKLVEGRFGNEWGDFVEVITKENLARLLKERGFHVHRIYGNVTDKENQKWELDAVAINGEEIVVIEAKASLSAKDVKLFVEKKLPKIREYLPEHKDKKIYGGVSYLKSKTEVSDKQTDEEGKNAAQYALEQGLFVISVTGDTACMLNDKSFVPKAF